MSSPIASLRAALLRSHIWYANRPMTRLLPVLALLAVAVLATVPDSGFGGDSGGLEWG